MDKIANLIIAFLSFNENRLDPELPNQKINLTLELIFFINLDI
jgi:hypothetical protein